MQLCGVMCGFYYIAFIKYMIGGKTLLDYTNLFFISAVSGSV